jgi:phosphoglycolate phosphatase
MNYQIALFDLDGTIINSQIGITKSVQYSLQSFGIIVDEPSTLVHFVGPPLHLSFQKYYGFDDSESRRAVEKYREYYREIGIFESEIYLGMAELLEEIHQNGVTNVLATSKPEVFARQILEHLDIIQYFDGVFGSNLDLTRSDKAEIICDIRVAYPQFEREKYVMIGDKEHDIIGARKNSIDSIGVLWGFGSQAELEYHQPQYIVREIDHLREILSV